MDFTDAERLLKLSMIIFIYLLIYYLFMYVFEHLKPIKHGYDIGFWIRDASMSQSVQLLRKEKKKAFNHFIPMDK